MANVYDFYKPHLASEYPEVDGPLTQTCYPGALETTYDHFRLKDAQRLARLAGKDIKEAQHGDVSLEDFDYVAFHSPYGKLVQKGFARLVGDISTLSQPLHRSSSYLCTALQRLSLESDRCSLLRYRPLSCDSSSIRDDPEQGH